MSTLDPSLPNQPPTNRPGFPMPSAQSLPILATLLVLVALYATACLRYDYFFTPRVAINLIGDNAYLGIAAIGVTFVILAGGIDLSVGTAIGCTSIFIATRVELHGWHPLLAIFVALVGGTLVGAIQGALIRAFDLQPFLVTLGGLFFYRGLGLLISRDSVPLTHDLYTAWSGFKLYLAPGVGIPLVALIFLALLVVAIYVAHFRPVGRSVFALGGNEQSALLMGLPVGRLKVGAYAFSGFCAALGGVALTIYKTSGDAVTGSGLELDAISAVVIGGTALTGGVGGPLGTLMGVLIIAIIQTSVTNYEASLNSWWARILIYLILLAFVVLQTLLRPKENHE